MTKRELINYLEESECSDDTPITISIESGHGCISKSDDVDVCIKDEGDVEPSEDLVIEISGIETSFE